MSDHVCLVCNLCCNGSLYPRLAVTEEERERLSERGVFFNKSDGSLRMELACNYLGTDGACQCYESRPAICRSYRCDLLRSVDAGFRTMPEAIEIAKEGRALREKADEAIHAALESGALEKPESPGLVHSYAELDRAHRLAAPLSAPAYKLAKYRHQAFEAFVEQFILIPKESSKSS